MDRTTPIVFAGDVLIAQNGFNTRYVVIGHSSADGGGVIIVAQNRYKAYLHGQGRIPKWFCPLVSISKEQDELGRFKVLNPNHIKAHNG